MLLLIQHSWSRASVAQPAAQNEDVLESAGGKPAMTPQASNPDTFLGTCANATFQRLASRRRSGLDKRPFFFAVGLHKCVRVNRQHQKIIVNVRWMDQNAPLCQLCPPALPESLISSRHSLPPSSTYAHKAHNT